MQSNLTRIYVKFGLTVVFYRSFLLSKDLRNCYRQNSLIDLIKIKLLFKYSFVMEKLWIKKLCHWFKKIWNIFWYKNLFSRNYIFCIFLCTESIKKNKTPMNEWLNINVEILYNSTNVAILSWFLLCHEKIIQFIKKILNSISYIFTNHLFSINLIGHFTE